MVGIVPYSKTALEAQQARVDHVRSAPASVPGAAMLRCGSAVHRSQTVPAALHYLRKCVAPRCLLSHMRVLRLRPFMSRTDLQLSLRPSYNLPWLLRLGFSWRALHSSCCVFNDTLTRCRTASSERRRASLCRGHRASTTSPLKVSLSVNCLRLCATLKQSGRAAAAGSRACQSCRTPRGLRTCSRHPRMRRCSSAAGWHTGRRPRAPARPRSANRCRWVGSRSLPSRPALSTRSAAAWQHYRLGRAPAATAKLRGAPVRLCTRQSRSRAVTVHGQGAARPLERVCPRPPSHWSLQ